MTIPELPHNLEAEKATLGSVLLNRDAVVKVADLTAPGDYYFERHALICTAMLSCYARRIPPDTRTVMDELRRMGKLDDVGGIVYLSSLVDEVPTAYHVAYYAQEVARTARLRRIIDAGAAIAAVGYNEQDDSEAYAQAQALLTAVAGKSRQTALTPISDILDAIYNDLDNTEPPAVSSGLFDYDKATGGGLWAGELVVPAGRPGHGKSSFVGTVAANLARADQRVCFFGLEMQRKEVVRRLLAAEAGVDSLAIRRRELDENDRRAVNEAMGRMSAWPMLLDDARQTASDIRTKVLRVIAEDGPVALVVVDYIQLVPVRELRGTNRAQAIGEVTRALKALAMECQCTVMAPSQLNREIQHRSDPIPNLADLRESGDIENDADTVVFVVRPELFTPGKDENIGHLYIGKQRSGPQNIKIEVFYDAPRTRFIDLDRWHDDD